jgi:hypothetical protein
MSNQLYLRRKLIKNNQLQLNWRLAWALHWSAQRLLGRSLLTYTEL